MMNYQTAQKTNFDDLNKEPKLEATRERQIAEARRIVLAHGWNSTSYQILNPGIRRWFSKTDDAVVGYVSARGNRRVVAGAPVCAKERLKAVAAEFESDAQEAGERVCYFCAEARLESIYADSKTHAKILLGAQPIWNPAGWSEIVATHKSLRAQLNRARNKGVRVAEWSSERARLNRPLLENVLREWLAARGLPPLGFLVEPNTLSRLFDRRIFVAENRRGEVLGFVVLSPVPTRNGWLFEQFPHRPQNAPNGTVELMIDQAMRCIAREGYGYATLGLAPLSQRANIEPFQNPLWLRLLLAWMRRHGQRFYNFDGLDRFKAKLRPAAWEPVFAIAGEPRISPQTLYAIAAAFSANAPVRLVASGLRRALATEAKWIRESIDKKSSAQ